MLDPAIHPSEKLFRAVFTLWWNDSMKRLTSAAFKDGNGVSVDRTGSRTREEIINNFKIRFKHLFAGASIDADFCYRLPVKLIYTHSKNKYHSCIHESDKEILLSDIHAEELAKHASKAITFV